MAEDRTTSNGSTLPLQNMTPLDDFGRSFTSNWHDNRHQQRRQQPITGDSTVELTHEDASIVTPSLQTAVSFGTTMTTPSHATPLSTNTLPTADDVSYPSTTPAAGVQQSQPRVVTPPREKSDVAAFPGQERSSQSLPLESRVSGKDTGRRTGPLSTTVLDDECQQRQQQWQQQQLAIAEPVALPYNQAPDDSGRCYV